MKHSCDQPVHTYFPSAEWALFICTNWLNIKNFLPSSWNDQSTNIQAILLHIKGSCTRGNSGGKDPWVREESEVESWYTGRRGKWEKLEAIISILLVLWLQWIIRAKVTLRFFFQWRKKKDLIFKKYTLISFTSEHHTYCKVILANYLRHFS